MTAKIVPISAVILSFRDPAAVVNLAREIAAADPRPAEILVVENGSPPSDQAQIRAGLPPATTLLEIPKNTGHDGWNRGVAAAKNEIVALFDQDVRIPPDFFGKMSAGFDADPRVQVVAARFRDPTGPVWPRVPGAHFSGNFLGGAILVKKSAWLRASGYPPEFFLYWGEAAVAARVLAAGGKIFVPADAEIFRADTDADRWTARRAFWLIRNKFWVIWRADPPGHAIRRTIFHATRTLKISAERGFLWVWARAVLAAVAGLPGQIRQRKICRDPLWLGNA